MIKRGELTSAQIIALVLAIGGFIVVGVFLYALFGAQEGLSDRELCHLSVVERASADPVLHAGSFIPLQCTTEKICITDKKSNKCKNFAGEIPSYVIIDTGKPLEARRIIEEETANAMFDCWSMLGEGKLDLFGEPLDSVGRFEPEKSSCVVCSRLSISEALWENENVQENIIKQVDVDSYMEKNRVPGSELTYLQTFTDQGVRDYPSVSEDLEPEDTGNVAISNHLAVVFFQISVGSFSEEVSKTLRGSFIAVGGLALSPVGNLLKNPYVALVTGAGILGAAGWSGVSTYRSGNVAAGYCGDFTGTREEARKGCSLTKFTEYSVDSINNLCGTLESRP